MTTLKDMATKRPPRRAVVDEHKRRMLAEQRAWRLRELREALNLTQTALAEELSVSQNRISTLERGGLDNVQFDTVRRYVEALGGSLHVEVEIGDETFTLA